MAFCNFSLTLKCRTCDLRVVGSNPAQGTIFFFTFFFGLILHPERVADQIQPCSAVTTLLIFVFVLAYTKSRFSHDAAHIVLKLNFALNFADSEKVHLLLTE